jgi:hypothetical protein
VDCKLLICELLSEMKAAKASYLEEQLLWRGAESADIAKSLKVLQDRGVIYRRKGGLLELSEPLSGS